MFAHACFVSCGQVGEQDCFFKALHILAQDLGLHRLAKRKRDQTMMIVPIFSKVKQLLRLCEV